MRGREKKYTEHEEYSTKWMYYENNGENSDAENGDDAVADVCVTLNIE